MEKTINLLQLQKGYADVLAGKEFLISSENQSDVPVHIEYKVIFSTIIIRPERNAIIFKGNNGFLKIQCIRQIVAKNLNSTYDNMYFDIVSTNYDDEQKPYTYRVLVQ